MKIKEFVENRIKVENKFKSIGVKNCGICKEKIECFDAIKKTFTNLDQLNSNYVCRECMNLFADEWRKTAFYITENKCKKLKQSDFEDLLFNQEIEFPCIISFSKSRKKHRLFRSKISYSLDKIYLSVDNGEVIFNIDNGWEIDIFKELSKIYNKYKISKSWFLNFPTNAIEKTIGLKKYMELENITKNLKNSHKFNLLIMFLNKNG